MNDFSSIYTEYYPKIVGYVKRLVGDFEAEDAAQEVFVKVNHSLEHFRAESSLSTWIYRIATNTAMDHLRRRSVKQAERVEEDISDDTLGLIDTSPLHDTVLIKKDMNNCIWSIVNGLPYDYRTVLVMSEIEGLTNMEIAEVLDISLPTTKIRIHRARTKLRNELEHQCNFYRDERNELSCDPKTPTLKFLHKLYPFPPFSRLKG